MKFLWWNCRLSTARLWITGTGFLELFKHIFLFHLLKLNQNEKCFTGWSLLSFCLRLVGSWEWISSPFSFYFCLQTQGRESIAAKLVANLITEAGADRVLACDLHSGQSMGYFDIPVDHVYCQVMVHKLHFLNQFIFGIVKLAFFFLT